MDDSHSEMTQLSLLYDPLCGWCYGATPSIRRLASEPGCTVQLVPVGLFANSGSRPMKEFAEHAWTSDQRIMQLTGQPFSERYRERVLGDRHARLDSGPATLALTALAQIAPEQELPMLETIQATRYVNGEDVTDLAVLATLLREHGRGDAARILEERPPGLVEVAAQRMSSGQKMLHTLGVHGVPTLVAHETGALRVISSDLLYGRVDELLTTWLSRRLDLNTGFRRGTDDDRHRT